MNLKQIEEFESQVLFSNYKKYPLFVQKGRKCMLYDFEGKRYLDLLSGIAVSALGYNHPRIANAMRKQLKKLLHISNLFYHPYQALLAGKLLEISGMERAFFCNSGTEAVEASFKLARGYAWKNKLGEGKNRILTLDDSFHGRTYGSLSATYNDTYRTPFGPLVPGFEFVKRNQVEDLQSKFDDQVCAIVIEPIQGEGGVHACSLEFLQAARDLCLKHRALLIFDEIQSGLGRTGRYFYFQKFGIRPDIMTLAKPLGVGLPLGSVLTSKEISLTFGPGDHGTTFGGGPLACRLGFEFVKILQEDGFLEDIREKGEFFRKKLLDLKRKYPFVVDVRGEGLMQAIEVNFPAREIVNQCLEAGFVINVTANSVLRFLPPYIITRKEIARFAKALDKIFSKVLADQ